MTKEYTIGGLSLDELNTVLLGLSQLPYFQVADLIAKIKKQGEDQYPR